MDPRENERIKRKMAKKAAEKPVEKIQIKEEIEVLDHPIFVEHLKQKLQAIKAQFLVSPGKGMRWCRTPQMALKEQGYLDDHKKMTDEFVNISMKKSKLSSALRSEIETICRSAFWDVREKFELIK